MHKSCRAPHLIFTPLQLYSKSNWEYQMKCKSLRFHRGCSVNEEKQLGNMAYMKEVL